MTEEQMKPTMPEVELPELPDAGDEQINILEAELDAEPEDAGSEADDALQAELEELRAERDDLRDRFMRALAEVENIRKRSERDRYEAERYGGSRLARDILPVHDNLRRALSAATEDQGEVSSALVEGVELTMRELLSVFKKHGIEMVAPERGDRFDPQLHQAMFEAPVPETKAGEIIEITEVGFTLHDRLLRPAKVGVSSTPAKPPEPEAEADSESEQ